jgi:hypothetical protein
VRISGLFVHPVKSGAALAVDDWPLVGRGLALDREYMVVDDAGVFLTQREVPALALVMPVLGDPFGIATPLGDAAVTEGGTRSVRVWQHTGPAVDCGDAAAVLLSEFLDRPCRLVRLAPQHHRPTEQGSGEVGFADGYPLLLTSESSLADLNTRLPVALPMTRFRPNVVIEGAQAFAEDRWATIQLGSVPVDVVKPCARCAITRVDQRTGVRGDGEPLRTLGTFRKAKGGVMFGQNAVHRELGTLSVGDEVSVLARRS